MIQEGTSFKFSNIISKGENTFWAGSNTSISYCAVVETAVDSATLCLPEKEPAEGIQKPFKDALVSPNKSTVTGKVAKVSPLHMRMQGTLPVKALLLKDVTAKAKVCLFGDNASSNYARGDVVQVAAVFPKTFQNQKQLTTSPISKCQFLSDMPEIIINQDDEETADPDFEEPLDVEEMHEITLTDFMDVDNYKCCSAKACRQKKYQGGKCPICNRTDSIMFSFRVNFLYSTEKEKDKK
ncbi:uncharacterized protein LOC125650952 [Ostrea edulis]|uniref:uncharacterized protein LOC125650952 n=1 Tax=Ostrea edulis TaxID=37623 RepID=UPI0024AECFE2|nr:uncharacterized protein LOC125650952 [Ostrea edulis]